MFGKFSRFFLMNPQRSAGSTSQHLPQPADSEPQGLTDANIMDKCWAADDTPADWNDFYFCSSESIPAECSWTGHETQLLETFDHSNLPASDPLNTAVGNYTNLFQPQTQDLSNVPQWLDGAYRPPVPCRYCRRHRLQCLILRTTSANPNPVSSCSSCVALFRECSLAKGVKRLPSGFETFDPVLGHLHGLPEHTEDGEQEQVLLSVENIEERKESKQFVRKGARVLREWFYQNQECPYPTEDQKNQFSGETGFSEKRITTWFANARRRQKQKIQSSNSASNIRTRAGSPLITSTLDSRTPMERWKASPPEDELVSESVIQDAIASAGLDASIDTLQLDGSAMDLFNFDKSSSHLPSSASSFGSRVSETSDSVSSTWSHQSGECLPFPMLPKTSRFRRRDHSEEHQYQCTFCTRSFKKRHDWIRHEKSVHLSLENWICTPNPNELQQIWYSQVAECSFCDTLFPGPAHLEEHEFYVCAEKPVADRSFTRKDYLWQHLRKFHGCTKNPVSDLEAWREAGANVHSRCGFCHQSLSTWTARADHLAEHFKNGMRMNMWVGDWGLSPIAMGVLRNATLPNQRSLAT